MRKKELWLYVPLLVLLMAATGVYFLISRQNNDSKAPTISMTTDTLSVSVTDPPDVLLQGVTAADDRDGDVTSLIVVETISDLTQAHTATVTYAAFDHSGNVAKATRTVEYVDYTPPVFTLKRPLVFSASTNVDPLSRITVTDALDGDISRNLKASIAGQSAETGINTAGTHQVTFRISNSMGDTVRLTLPVDVLPANTYTGSITLRENLIYLEQGQYFQPKEYFLHMSIGSMKHYEDDGVKLTVHSDVDTSEPGVYSVTYTAQYRDTQAFTRLIVVVQ